MPKKNTRPTVSVVMIVKDEEAVLAKSLASSAWADQVVVYDTGSTDATREIAARFTDTVVEGYWDDDFAGARNRAQAHATGDWILVLDADEVLVGDPTLLRRRLARGPEDTFMMRVEGDESGVNVPLATQFTGSVIAGVRIFRRGSRTWQGQIHEQPVPTGTSTGAAQLHAHYIVHSGYSAEAFETHDKGNRNLRIAERNLEALIADGGSPDDIIAARVHVIRSLVLASRPEDALRDAEELLPEITQPQQRLVLAFGMSAVAINVGTDHQVRLWLREWEEHDESPVFARAMLARYELSRGDGAQALEVLEQIPSVTTTSQGQRLARIDLAATEIAALVQVGRRRPAIVLARRAIARDVAPGLPGPLAEMFTPEQIVGIVSEASPRLWREMVQACVLAPTPAAQKFLAIMYQARPGDVVVLSAATLLAPVLDLEGAATWAAELRRHGETERCPLVQIALDGAREPRVRALCGALAFSAYQDTRGMAGLADALPLVAPEHEAELLAELDVVAPGLVGAGA